MQFISEWSSINEYGKEDQHRKPILKGVSHASSNSLMTLQQQDQVPIEGGADDDLFLVDDRQQAFDVSNFDSNGGSLLIGTSRIPSPKSFIQSMKSRDSL